MMRTLFVAAVAVVVLGAAAWLTMFLLIQSGFGDGLPYWVKQRF